MCSLVVLLGLAVAVRASLPAPFAAWSSMESVFNQKHAFAPQVNLADVLIQQFDPIFESQGVLVVFHQAGLRVEDLSLYGDAYAASSNGGSFANLKAFLQSPSAILMPNVVSSSSETIDFLEHTVARRGGVVLKAQMNGHVDCSLFNANTINLLIVELDTVSPLPRGQLLASLDAAMQRIMGQIKVNGHVSGMLFGSLTAPVVVQQAAPKKRSVSSAATSGIAPPPLAYLYFTPPIFMGILVGLLIVFVGFIGVYELMISQNPDRLPSSTDKNLVVPNN